MQCVACCIWRAVTTAARNCAREYPKRGYAHYNPLLSSVRLTLLGYVVCCTYVPHGTLYWPTHNVMFLDTCSRPNSCYQHVALATSRRSFSEGAYYYVIPGIICTKIHMLYAPAHCTVPGYGVYIGTYVSIRTHDMRVLASTMVFFFISM